LFFRVKPVGVGVWCSWFRGGVGTGFWYEYVLLLV